MLGAPLRRHRLGFSHESTGFKSSAALQVFLQGLRPRTILGVRYTRCINRLHDPFVDEPYRYHSLEARHRETGCYQIKMAQVRSDSTF